MSGVEWDRDWLPEIDEMMHQAGFTGSDVYTNGKLTVGDVSPTNIGFDNNGNIKFFDAAVYRHGGKIH